MEPVLAAGEYVLVSRLAYVLGRPARGDLVVLRHPRQPDVTLIKRVVALPGDRVRIEGGAVLVNGEPLRDGVGPSASAEEPREWHLGPEEYFVLGHREASSLDSRRFGPVPRDCLVGRPWFCVWPPRGWRILPRDVAALANPP
jgi:signal peptidase I